MKGNHVRALLLSLGIPLLGGLIVALFTQNGMAQYATLAKPPLSPPGFVFGIVWPILYLMMGLAAWLVWRQSDHPEQASALGWYTVQLIFNFLWPIWFFVLDWRLFAFFWLLMLLLLAGVTTVKFYGINKKAGLLMLPYLLWLVFAAYLNFGVWVLNR